MEDALLKIDLLMINNANGSVIVGHTDITAEIDKHLKAAASASEKMGLLRRFYSTN
jgi:hypothetical protein